jgi:hypothetical protein
MVDGGRTNGGCEDMDVDGRILPSTSISSQKILNINSMSQEVKKCVEVLPCNQPHAKLKPNHGIGYYLFLN